MSASRINYQQLNADESKPELINIVQAFFMVALGVGLSVLVSIGIGTIISITHSGGLIRILSKLLFVAKFGLAAALLSYNALVGVGFVIGTVSLFLISVFQMIF